MKQDLVSIIMPTYNCANFIVESIKSVQAQTYSNWELLIIDDFSTDDTEEIVRNFTKQDNRIKYEKLLHNSGAAIARNTALQLAKGRWIAFLDSDDLWLPNKLSDQIAFMLKNGITFSYHKYKEILENGEEIGVEVSGLKKISRFQMYACCWPGCLSVMYDGSKLGLIQVADIKKNNDTALWLKIINSTSCYLLDTPLGFYRRRKGSITPTSISERIKAHYPLFRVAQGMNPLRSVLWTGINIIGNLYKKSFYVKRYKPVSVQK